MSLIPRLILSRESRKILESAEEFSAKTGKRRISLNPPDYQRLVKEYQFLKQPKDGILTVNSIEFIDRSTL